IRPKHHRPEEKVRRNRAHCHVVKCKLLPPFVSPPDHQTPEIARSPRHITRSPHLPIQVHCPEVTESPLAFVRPREPKPEWLKVRAPGSENYLRLRGIM